MEKILGRSGKIMCTSQSVGVQRMKRQLENGTEEVLGLGLATSGIPNTCQNINLSSPAAVATVHPFGDCKTCAWQRESAKRSTQIMCTSQSVRVQRMKRQLENGTEEVLGLGLATSGIPNTCQNINLSSLAADATVHPFGDFKTSTWQRESAKQSTQQANCKKYLHRIANDYDKHTSSTFARNRILDVCPVSSAILCIDGYFQKIAGYE